MTLFLLTGLLLQQPPVDIPFPQRTDRSLYMQLGRCNADLGDALEWAGAKQAKIDELLKQIEELKKK